MTSEGQILEFDAISMIRYVSNDNVKFNEQNYRSRSEKRLVGCWLAAKQNFSEIARVLSRNRSTSSREVNKGDCNKYIYRVVKADKRDEENTGKEKSHSIGNSRNTSFQNWNSAGRRNRLPNVWKQTILTEKKCASVRKLSMPLSVWERGANENINGLIRQFFPKGTDFSKISCREIKKVQNLLNGRPRKVLTGKLPMKFLTVCCVRF